ncbi:MAG: glutathione S-transferase family protein [Alphaproteobacteria bacterium]|jgi:glutathione S-transferase|nr:glutathione S-transferase family protein [Alphaproteobacteria bacterium]MDP7223321.1 glutathione S-transferase family protein [Alphaproteobacteria bacterium]
MYTLYYSPGVCSMSVHVALEELGVAFEPHKIDLAKGEQRSLEYLKINPRGQVGALMTPDGLVTENAAMIIYLNDTHDGHLIPKEGYARATALQWLMFANSTLHPAYGKALFCKKNDLGDEAMKIACDAIQTQWGLVEQQLDESGGPYLCGENFTAGDIYVAVVANWDFFPQKPKFGPKTKALLEAVTSRPAYQRAIETEQIEYTALAA